MRHRLGLATRTHKSVSRHFLLQAPQCPCSVQKRFSRDHRCRGRSKPGCRIVGSHTRWELTTWADLVMPPSTFDDNDNIQQQLFNVPLSGTTRVSWAGTRTLRNINQIHHLHCPQIPHKHSQTFATSLHLWSNINEYPGEVAERNMKNSRTRIQLPLNLPNAAATQTRARLSPAMQ